MANFQGLFLKRLVLPRSVDRGSIIYYRKMKLRAPGLPERGSAWGRAACVGAFWRQSWPPSRANQVSGKRFGLTFLLGLVTVAVISLDMAAPAHAKTDHFSVAQLDRQCNANPVDSPTARDFAHCLGFIRAALDMSVAWGALTPTKYMCLREHGQATVSQVLLVWRKWVAENPEALHQPAAFAMFGLLVKTFPCH